MIVDAHAHIYDILAGYGARGECRALGKGRGIWATGEIEQFFPEEYGDLGFSAETLVRLMEESGVDHAVLLQGANYGFHNDYAAEAAGKYPDKFTAVGTLDPYGVNSLKILERFVTDYKFCALKFEVSQSWGLSGYHPYLKMDDAAFAPILERANELGMTIVIDMGPMGTSGFDISALKKIAAGYPDITFVMTHCFFPREDGKNEQRLEYMRELVSDHFVFDISNISRIYWVEPWTFLKKVRSSLGAERMLWGTDIPGTLNQFTYRRMIEFVTESDIFKPEELELVMGKNAERVYCIEERKEKVYGKKY